VDLTLPSYGAGSIAAHPCKERKDGAPSALVVPARSKPGPPRRRPQEERPCVARDGEWLTSRWQADDGDEVFEGGVVVQARETLIQIDIQCERVVLLDAHRQILKRFV